MSNIFNTNNGNYCWSTSYSHPDNQFTMQDFLNNHLPENAEVVHIEGTYAEVFYEGKYFGLHASGNGDSFNHCIHWETI